MLNKNIINFCKILIIILFCGVSYSGSSFADNKIITISPKFFKIKEPFVSSGTAHFLIKNNLPYDLTISNVSSPNARRTNIYKKSINNLGIPKKKEIKQINIRGNKTTEFSDKTFQISLTGLKRNFKTNEEVILKIEFKKHGEYSIHLPVIYQIK